MKCIGTEICSLELFLILLLFWLHAHISKFYTFYFLRKLQIYYSYLLADTYAAELCRLLGLYCHHFLKNRPNRLNNFNCFYGMRWIFPYNNIFLQQFSPLDEYLMIRTLWLEYQKSLMKKFYIISCVSLFSAL